MKKTLIAAAALVAMVGCNKTLIESPVAADSEFGYINVGVSTDTEMITTKAVTTPSEEEQKAFTYTLGGEKKSWGPTKGSALPADAWKVPAGSYTVTVVNLTEDEAYTDNLGKMRVQGSSTITVNAGLPTDCPIVCKPVNSKISFLYTADFDVVFDEFTVDLTNGTRTAANVGISAVENSASATAAFFEPTEQPDKLTWTLKAKNAAGIVKTYTGDIDAKAGTWTYVTFNAAKTDGSINVSIQVNDEYVTDMTITESIDPTLGTEQE